MKNNPTGANPKGRMAVYNGVHKLIFQKLYYTSKGMKKIMDDWFQMFADEPDSYITVRPYSDSDGRKYKKGDCVRLEVPKGTSKVFLRPPAIYNNIQTYDYNQSKNGHGH